MDYLLPTAMEAPVAHTIHVPVPTPLNPLGAKGAGEGGTIPAPAEIIAAIEDAVARREFVVRSFPLAPEDIRELARAHHDVVAANERPA